MTFPDLDVDLVELTPLAPATARSAADPSKLNEIAFRANAWLPREIEKLRSMFVADETFEAIAKALRRPLAGVTTKVYDLGLRRNSFRHWTETEDQILVRRYGAEPASAIAADLGRSAASVYARAAYHGLTEGNPPPYTEWEEAQIRAGYAQGVPVGQIATLIGRPFAGVVARAVRLGLRHKAKPDEWSNDEMARALELAHEGHRYLAIIDMLAGEGFPRRSKIGFGLRIREMGYGRGWGRAWLPEEDELLRRAYGEGASLTPLRDRLGRTRHSLKWRAEHLGLQGTHLRPDGFRTEPPWTEAEIARLREAYGTVTNRKLAAEFGRSKMAISTKAWNLGLDAGYWRYYTGDEKRAIRIAFENDISVADLAIVLERDAMTVSKYLTDKMGLRFGRRPRRKPPLTLAEILAIEDGPPPDVAGGDNDSRRRRVMRGAWRPRPSRLDLVLQRRIRPRARGARR